MPRRYDGRAALTHVYFCSRSNSAMTELRRANLNGVYDTHTNMMFYPKIMQPTHAKWEQIPSPVSPAEAGQKQLANGLPNGHHLPNGTTADHDAMDVERTDSHPPKDEQQQPPPSSPTIFHPVPAPVSRTFTIIDTLFTSPPLSNTGYPGPDGNIADPTSGPNGLGSIPDEIVDELPEDCRRALEAERQREREWKRGWGTEGQSALRGELKIGFNGWPV